MSIDCEDIRNCRLEVSKLIEKPNVFHFCLDPSCESDRPHVGLAMCDNREAISVTLQPKAQDELRTTQGTRDMVEIIREIVKSKGCVIIRVASENDFAYLRLMRALYTESVEKSWMTYVDGDDGLYSRALLAIGGSARYYALPFRHGCSFHLTRCANIVETWGKLWVVLPPCAEFTRVGCPVTADDYVPVVAREIEQVAITNEEQSENSYIDDGNFGSSEPASEDKTNDGPESDKGERNEDQEAVDSDFDDAVSSVYEDDAMSTISNVENQINGITDDNTEETISSDDEA